jgi:hypothetical protein
MGDATDDHGYLHLPTLVDARPQFYTRDHSCHHNPTLYNAPEEQRARRADPHRPTKAVVEHKGLWPLRSDF